MLRGLLDWDPNQKSCPVTTIKAKAWGNQSGGRMEQVRSPVRLEVNWTRILWKIWFKCLIFTVKHSSTKIKLVQSRWCVIANIFAEKPLHEWFKKWCTSQWSILKKVRCAQYYSCERLLNYFTWTPGLS